MPRIVNFEGKQISEINLPPNCMFIQGVWYSSADKLPAELKEGYAPVFTRHMEDLRLLMEKAEKLKKKPVTAPPSPAAVSQPSPQPVEKPPK